MSVNVQTHNHQAWQCLKRNIRLYMFLQTHQESWQFVCSVQENMKQNIKSEYPIFWNLTFHRGKWWLRVRCIVVCVLLFSPSSIQLALQNKKRSRNHVIQKKWSQIRQKMLHIIGFTWDLSSHTVWAKWSDGYFCLFRRRSSGTALSIDSSVADELGLTVYEELLTTS